MAESKTRKSSFGIFLIYAHQFLRYCYALRALLGIQLWLILLLGGIFAWIEGLPLMQGLYFSLITSTTTGFGDIAPRTGVGQVISVVLSCFGLIFFGIVIAVAQQAFRVTIDQANITDPDNQN
ncbi:MAG: two pore domain potassium channel family protein [Planctomycetales bacterium]|nr:two pore domain potassium channel family protein [Planctomycetales bacterium]